MLNIYISHAAQDWSYVADFLEKIRPMEEKYQLRIWYNHPEPEPEIPFPWKILFFWYRPPGSPFPYNRYLPEEVEQAHIYLFFTSQHSISTPWIQTDEVQRAIARYREQGSGLVRIFPILVSSSQWKTFSPLTAFPNLGTGSAALNQLAKIDDGWDAILEDLKPVIETLRRNHQEENMRLGLPVSPDPVPWRDTPVQLVPFPKWLGWAMIVAILFSVARFYEQNCTRKAPPGRPPGRTYQEEYRREQPITPPEDLVVPRDTVKESLR